jgi:hypothetical protein
VQPINQTAGRMGFTGGGGLDDDATAASNHAGKLGLECVGELGQVARWGTLGIVGEDLAEPEDDLAGVVGRVALSTVRPRCDGAVAQVAASDVEVSLYSSTRSKKV